MGHQCIFCGNQNVIEEELLNGDVECRCRNCLKTYIATPETDRTETENWNYRLCPVCDNDNTTKNGKRVSRTGTFQRYRCNSCQTSYRGEKIDDTQERPSVLQGS